MVALGGSGIAGGGIGAGTVAAWAAATAHVGVHEGVATAAGGLVEIEADQGTGAATLPAVVGTRAAVHVVVGAGANQTVGFSQAGEGDGPEFKIHRIPT